MVELTCIFYIEALGNDKKAVETAISEIEEKLKQEKIKVLSIKKEDVIETEDPKFKYSAVLEAKIHGHLADIVDVILKYGPSIVELEDLKGEEIEAEKLVEILARVSAVMGKLMENFGTLAAYPDLSTVPEPKVGYSEEEIEKLIIDSGFIRYRFVIEAFGSDKKEVERNMKKALSLEGVYINKFASKLVEEREYKGNRRVKLLIAFELLSSLESLFILTAKYAPIGIVIVEPELIEITPNELQNSLSELATMVNELIHRPFLAIDK
ncbi:hypothetical protein A3L04_07745 [Thermococcus chitonophagus]|uniref:Uncharacterized protein MJ0538 n=1 Tax=Thermococcus chitonophagus TaxID=54262 RepID=A0A160VTI7_9EURY|nr:hypothetical protein [Thermococcus chitonophagus]ASJ16975.1 hypothetical protein A3L04_07745 [Thermococcus chitonophagus]CUX78457.1 Uncharacterized protein MJ0538 [Thermococcus chitonophagus]